MLLEVKNLKIGYDREGIKSNINFSVDAGDFLSIVGENGEGKSTLMKTLLNIIKPISGDIIFDNSISKNTIGYLSQNNNIPDDFPTTVKEIILSGFVGNMGLRPIYNKLENDKVDEILNKLDMIDYKNKSFSDLSGGQKQRVLLARILVSDKKILFLDEPTSALDEKIKLEFYELISRLNKNEKLTIIMIIHDSEIAKKYSNHILYMKNEAEFV